VKIKWNDAAFRDLRKGPQTAEICEEIAEEIAERARAIAPNPRFRKGIVVVRRSRNRLQGGAAVLFLVAALSTEAKHGTISKAFNNT